MLQHSHMASVVFGVSPVSFCIEVAEVEFLLQANLDSRSRSSNFSGHKGFAAARRFVIKENSIASEKVIASAIVYGLIKRIAFGTCIRLWGLNGVFSVCGVSSTIPNISLLLAW